MQGTQTIAEDVLPGCINLLSEISRDPAVYGDDVAALALGTLCYFSSPGDVVESNSGPPDRSLVALAMLSRIAHKEAISLGAGPLLAHAEERTKTFLDANRETLVHAGQSNFVGAVLEKAAQRLHHAQNELKSYMAALSQGQAPPTEDRIAAQEAREAVESSARSARPTNPERPKNSQRSGGRSNIPDDVLLNPDHFTILGKDTSLSRPDRTVFKGMRLDIKQPHTLIELTSPWMLRDDYISALVAWAEALRNLKDPRIAQVHGILNQDGRMFVVYESLAGTTLDERMHSGPMEETEMVELLLDIASAVEVLHEQGLVHRGVRPDRVLIDRRQNLKLFAFPPPKPKTNKGTEEETLRDKGLMGEVRYMAPELCLGSEMPAPSGDVYSLGILACELLLGEQNLQRIAGEHVKFWLNWHVDLYKKPVPLCEIDPSISEEVSDLIGKMLEKRVKNRYPSMVEVRKEIGEIRAGRRSAKKKGPERLTGTSGAASSKPKKSVAVTLESDSRLRTMLVIGGGAMCVIMLTIILIVAFMPGDQPAVVKNNTSPARAKLEKALAHFRNEEFDEAEKILTALSRNEGTPQIAEARKETADAIVAARTANARHMKAFEDGTKEQAEGNNEQASRSYDQAILAYRELSRIIQKPDRPLPKDLETKSKAIAPRILLDTARQYLRANQFDLAKKKVYVCLDNYPGSPVTGEAEELSRTIKDASAKLKVHEDSFKKGMAFESGKRYLDAAQEYFKAKQAWVEVSDLTKNPEMSSIPVELLDRINGIYSRLWHIVSPEEGKTVQAEELTMEVSIPEKFFENVIVAGKTILVKGDFLTIPFPNAQQGRQTIQLIANTRDGNAASKKVSFTFKYPPDVIPEVAILSIATNGSVAIASIQYRDRDFRVQEGWKSPDEVFEVLKVDRQGIKIRTRKGKEITITY